MIRIDELKRAVAKAAVIAACGLLPAMSFASQDTDAMKADAAAKTSAKTAAPAAGGRIYVVNGEVFVIHGNQPAHRVTDNEPIVSGTLVNTGDNGSALLKFEDGQVVTMQPDSSFKVREYRYVAKKVADSNIVFSMLKGGMRFVTGLIGQRNKQAFRLSTPNATIGIRGTDFMVAMADKTMYSQVLTGKITMTNAAGMQVVAAGQSAAVASSTALAAIVSAAPVPAGTFNVLRTIPVDPTAIPPAAPAAPPAPVSVAPAAAGETAAEAGTTAAGAAAGAGLIAGAVSTPESTPAAAETAAPEAPAPEVAAAASAEPVKAPEEKTPEEKTPASEERSGVGVTAKAGTLGLGVELNLAFSDYLGARLGYNAFDYNYSKVLSSVDYDAKLKLGTFSILADWYPFAGGFRASGGLMYNNNQASLTGVPSGGSFTINGKTFTGAVQSTMSFNNVAPYFGIGWGNPVHSGKGWGMTSDIGVLFQGSPKTDMAVTCTGGTCPTAADIASENAQLQDDLKNFKWWPVASIGISYQW